MKGARAVGLPALALAWALTLPFAGCGGDPGDAGSDPARSVAAEATGPAGRTERQDGRSDGSPAADDDVEERLRSLPYAGFGSKGGERVGVVRQSPSARPGYRLITIQARSRADLVSPSGEVVRSWTVAESDRWERAVPAADGGLLVVGVAPLGDPDAGIPDEARYLAKLDREGRTVWKRFAPVHHDLVERPDGSLLVLTFRRRKVPSVHPTLDVRDDRVDVFESDGTPRANAGCSLLEALVGAQAREPLHAVRPSSLGVVPWVDLVHANSVEWLDAPPDGVGSPADGPGVLICSRHQNRVAWIDWDTCRATWSWGADTLSGPHDATVLPDGDLIVFDNGLASRRSRILWVRTATGAVVREWTATPPTAFFTVSKGSAQRLPDGHVLAAESDAGRAVEIDAGGEIVWEWLARDRDAEGRRAAIVRIRDLGPSPAQAVGLP